MNNTNKYITLGLLFLALISIATIYLINHQVPQDNLIVEIYSNGELYQKVNLSITQTQQIKVTGKDGHFNIVEIKDGQVRVKEADCPTQVCVKTGWLSLPGQTSFCAPNRLKVTIKGGTNAVDTITN